MERRNQNRAPAYWAGRINYNRNLSSLECVVRNTSPTGAKLLLPELTFVPGEFHLFIPKQRTEFLAKVVWRQRDALGVRFEHGKATYTERQCRQPERLRQQPRLRIAEPSTQMALIRRLKTLRQQSALLRRRLLAQCE